MTQRRRGAILIQAVLMLFAFFGMAALVADLGLASLEQQRMQDAADSAAIEGLRSGRSQGAAFAEWSMASVDASSPTFDAEVDGGSGSFDSNAQIALAPRWLPSLQENVDDEPQGDFVGGVFDPAAPNLERSDYSRDDFAPGGGNSLLARLRRTNDPLGLDEASGVSSHGPTLPYLFGRGSLIAGAARAGGITVRATAIADGAAANAAFAPRGIPNELPLCPIAIDFAVWIQPGDQLAVSVGTTALAAPPLTFIRKGDEVGTPGVIPALPPHGEYVTPLFKNPSHLVVAFGVMKSTASGLFKLKSRVIANATALDPSGVSSTGDPDIKNARSLALAPVLVR